MELGYGVAVTAGDDRPHYIRSHTDPTGVGLQRSYSQSQSLRNKNISPELEALELSVAATRNRQQQQQRILPTRI